MENTGDIAQPAPLTPEERLKIFNEVNNKFAVRTKTTIGMDVLGRTDVGQAIELTNQLETLDLSNAKEGDIVWWLTENSNNYFLVSGINELNKELSGSFK
ncbi:MAG: hypothetical protein Q7T54_00820, partial [Candidatus Levybacteria bacterium]|nr:hypothetical protein [Candidatus Levybacteria bacterium]